MSVFFENENGKLIHGDNLEELDNIQEESIDSCISDFPYDLSFMGKKWDNHKDFYEWNYQRALKLLKVLKHGGYVAIFGHPKTNHRMKCAFEDAGFKIVEEIDWIYLTGMPKNQDISKLFIKNGKEELSKTWEGWKTAGLKPSHEPITIFQKSIEGRYIDNIEKYKCGGMNIDACRIPISKEDVEMLNAKASKNPTTNYSDSGNRIYGKFAEDKAVPPNEDGRFPSNLIFDEYTAKLLDEQTGIKESKRTMRGIGFSNSDVFGNGKSDFDTERGYDDVGGGSKIFNVIKYNQKITNKEKTLSNGEKNPHVTVKPVELIKWLIKLLTPIDGTTIDITAGSCTHAIACEELNRDNTYKLNWINIELLNTKEEPYCEVGKMRLENL